MNIPIPTGATAPPIPAPVAAPAAASGSPEAFGAALQGPAGPAARAGAVDPFGRFERLAREVQVMNEGFAHRDADFAARRTALVERGLAADHPELVRLQADYQSFCTERLEQLVGVQMRVHQASFEVELASKVIEHGTHGARTVLQTQT